MRCAIVLAVALSGLGCDITGPKEDLSGHWVAQGAGHSLLFGLMLMQSGDLITGKACGSSEGTVFFRDVPVTGEYPDVQFTTPSGDRFSGKQDGTMDIVGTYANGDLRFKRAITPLCN